MISRALKHKPWDPQGCLKGSWRPMGAIWGSPEAKREGNGYPIDQLKLEPIQEFHQLGNFPYFLKGKDCRPPPQVTFLHQIIGQGIKYPDPILYTDKRLPIQNSYKGQWSRVLIVSVNIIQLQWRKASTWDRLRWGTGPSNYRGIM